ncbi:leucine-rich repeat-containing protein 18 [Hypomesus transpacificus]|uniref:leucine-rich repeat-containing protein 18 n=1 Tax=Hypomesus transpacificus TaxID=137520 RepID=UPI001F07D6F1|nr:leucine-rich repeat-containing protein 18 [Hypomesus transpacificus]
MAKGKGRAKGKTVTLKMAKTAMRVMPDGRTRLDLSNTGIDTFPKCLLKLADTLDELDLSRNQLQKLPDCIGDMLSLKSLDLHSNQLEVVPMSIGQLVELSHLNLSNNLLTSEGLPQSLGCLTGLQSLNLGMNNLDSLPDSMVALTSLQELGLFDNLLSHLPEFVRHLPNISKINTKRNPLSSNQGAGGQGASSQVTRGELSLYLANEASLCKDCVARCREERDRKTEKRKGGDEENRRPFSGLITPNSVAQLNQEAWR